MARFYSAVFVEFESHFSTRGAGALLHVLMQCVRMKGRVTGGLFSFVRGPNPMQCLGSFCAMCWCFVAALQPSAALHVGSSLKPAARCSCSTAVCCISAGSQWFLGSLGLFLWCEEPEVGAPSELQCVLLAGSPAKAWQKVQSCRGFVGGLDSDERPSSFSLAGGESKVLSVGTVWSPVQCPCCFTGWKLCEPILSCCLPFSLCSVPWRRTRVASERGLCI